MTKEEKNEMYRKNREKQIKSRKSKIIALIVLPLVGVALTLLLGALGKSRQTELESATVLDGVSIGEFLAQNGNGTAVYTGTIKAVDPAVSSDEGGEYIKYRRTVEQVEKIRDEENDKYDTVTTTLSDDMDHCSEIKIDDVIVDYSAFHELPSYADTKTEGASSNQFKTEFSYTPAQVDGTFYLKCKDGKVSSAQYFASDDIAGENKSSFNLARIIIWLLVIAIDIFLVVDVIKTTKAIKLIGEKYQ